MRPGELIGLHVIHSGQIIDICMGKLLKYITNIIKGLSLFLGNLFLSILASVLFVYVFYLSYPFIYTFFGEADRGALSEDYFAAFGFVVISAVLFLVGIPVFFLLIKHFYRKILSRRAG